MHPVRRCEARLRRALSPLLLTAFLAAAGPAWARAPESWATVNRCDQAANAIGVRAGVAARPGERTFVRFEAQWYRIATRRFAPTGASSRWVRVGGGTGLAQAGFSFTFGEPPLGTQFVLRGKVDIQWRVPRKGGGWRITRRASRVTRAGMRGVGGAIPAGKSDALCVLAPG